MLNRASVRIVRDVREWLSSRPDQGVADVDWLADGDATRCLELLLRSRENWLGKSDPTLWKTGDVHRLLIDVAAPRLVDLHGLSERGPATLRVLVDFLDGTDRFHPGTMRVATLRRELNTAAAKFPVAMSDESVWRLAKRIFTAIRADGVDLADEVAVDGWAAVFNTAPAARRRAVLGVLIDRQPELLTCQFVIRDSQVAAIAAGAPVPAELRRHDPDACDDCLEPPDHPPVALPAATELADAARGSTLVRKMSAYGRWVGTGRPVTKEGFVSTADTRSLGAAVGYEIPDSARDLRDHLGLTRGWWLALDTEILRLHRTVVVAGPALAAVERVVDDQTDPEQVLRVWKDIADIAVSGPTQLADRDHSAKKLDEFCRPWGPRALGELYRINEPVQLDDLVDTLVTDYHGPDASDILAAVVGAAVRAGMYAGVEAGAVAVTVPADAEVAELTRRSSALLDEPAWVVAPVAGTRVQLTPLGQYLVRLNLLAEGTHAPLLEPATDSLVSTGR